MDIKSLSFEELCQYFLKHGQRAFRAQQVFSWIYQKNACHFSDMKNLPVDLQHQLKKDFIFSTLYPAQVLTSADNTKKFLFSCQDQEHIESVFIPTAKRITLCVSTQVGCRFGCYFCASGLNGFKRNLRSEEILNQILYIKSFAKDKRISHIVFMGVGEPLDNYEEVFKAVRMINDPRGLGIAARRITISTCGLIPEILRMAKENLQVELAVSLHAPNDAIRQKLMPVNHKYPFEKLIAASREYSLLTRRQVTFEYVLINGLNDDESCARELARKLKGMLAKVNLIPCNDVEPAGFHRTSHKTVLQFQKILVSNGIPATIRRSRGMDIQAACGQLRYNFLKK